MKLVRIGIFLALLATPAFAQTADLIVEKKSFELSSYTTAAGETIKNVKIGWEAAGTLNADKSNAILVRISSPRPVTRSADTRRAMRPPATRIT